MSVALKEGGGSRRPPTTTSGRSRDSTLAALESQRARLTRSPILPVLVFAALLLIVPAIGLSGAHYFLLVTIALYGTMALGLTVIWGFCGQPSFGHAALFGVGAYTVGTLTVLHQWGVWPALVLAPIVGAAGGLVFALPAMRGVRADQLALGGFALCEVFQVVEGAAKFTGASDGLPGVAPLTVFGNELVTPIQVYRPAVIVLAIGYVAARLLRGSAAGRAMRAVGGDELAARTLGARVLPLKVAAFVIGGAMAGLAGGVYACFAGFVSSLTFDVNLSFEVAVMVIVGGLSSLSGAIVGATVVLAVQDALQTDGSVSIAVTGVLMIIAVMIRSGAVRRGLFRLRATRRRLAATRSSGPANSGRR